MGALITIVLLVGFYGIVACFAESEFKAGFVILGVTGLIIAFFFMIGVAGIPVETSKGQHTGYITAVQRQGLIFKTARAYVKTDTQSSQEEMYCIKDENVEKQLIEMAEKKQQVVLKYKGQLIQSMTKCNGEGEEIYAVEAK